MPSIKHRRRFCKLAAVNKAVSDFSFFLPIFNRVNLCTLLSFTFSQFYSFFSEKSSNPFFFCSIVINYFLVKVGYFTDKKAQLTQGLRATAVRVC